MLMKIYSSEDTKNIIITLSIICICLCLIYFIKKIHNFLNLRIEVKKAKKDLLNPYHVYWYYMDTLQEQILKIQILEDLKEKANIVETKIINTFIDAYTEILKEHTDSINNGKELKIKSNNKIFNLKIYTQKDEKTNYILQGILVDGKTDNVFIVKKEKDVNKYLKKIFKKYEIIKESI